MRVMTADMPTPNPLSAAVVGAGPAGLMAAQALAEAGIKVDVFDAMPSAGRKFLLAGKGGLNLTHAEPLPALPVALWCPRTRGRPLARSAVAASVARLGGEAWASPTFVGSSGRVFPNDLKAAPLLRAWLHRLRERGVGFHMRHRWLGWSATGGDVALRRAGR